MNLLYERKRGASIASIRDTIRWNLTRARSTRRDYWNGSRYLEHSQRLDALGKELRDALINADVDAALSALRDYDDVRGDRNDWVDWLEDKLGGHYFQCYDCSEIGHSDDSYNVEDDYRVCSCCVDNYYYSERRGYYCNDSDEDDDYNDDDGYNNIGSYHSSRRKLGHIPSMYDNRKPRILLGLELEMEIGRDFDLDDKAEHVLDSIGHYHSTITNTDYQYCLLESDGSLTRGFELVTGYTGLDVHAQQLAFFKNRFVGAKSHNTTTCGLHIHICKADMSMLHAAKMILFINDEKNLNLVKAIARRDASGYAKFQNKQTDKYWLKDALRGGSKADKLRHLNNDRYEALNFQNDKTIEFRLFKGTLKYSTIMACLEFTYATWLFCRDTSQAQLSTTNFLKYICLENNRRDTVYLRAYLGEKGFALPYTSKPRPVAYGGASQAANTTSEEI
jgi:Putative amidoligase enzyme